MDEATKNILEKAEKGTLKWVQCTWFKHSRLIEQEFYLRTGSYQWAQVWKGDVVTFNEIKDIITTEFDIIQVNISGQDLHLPNKLRELLDESGNTHTKIVANLDYTVELWQSSFDYIQTIKDCMKGADMIFGTEPHMVNAMQILLGRKVYCTPHPCHVKRLKSIRPKRKLEVLSVVWHRYDNNAMLPSLIGQDLVKRRRLIGYEESSDRKKFCTATMYDEFLGATNYMDFCDQLQESEIVIDPFTLTSHGRTTIDCAALGVPVIGSNRVESCNRCYPYTTVDPWDIKAAREILKKLLNDKEFKEKVIKTALENVEYYNHKNCKTRFLSFLEKGSYKLNPEEI